MVNIDDYSLVRLFDDSSDAVVQHISSLSDEDLYLRFGYLITPPLLKSYIETTLATVNTRTRADFWFGINRGSELVATLHVAILDDTAEFAFSTAEAHRGRSTPIRAWVSTGYRILNQSNLSLLSHAKQSNTSYCT
jgi:hypothetical protein